MKKELEKMFYESLCASWASANGSRSPKRTEALHKSFENDILRNVVKGQGEYLHEEDVDTADGTFSIDILHRNQHKEIAFLLKAIGSSYNKNRKNYANTTKGEVFRFLTGTENRKVVHIDFIPNKAPKFGKKETKIETTNPQNLDYFYEAISPIFPDKATKVTFMFDIDDKVLLNVKSRKETYENLISAGPDAIKCVNYKEEMEKLKRGC